MWTEKAALEQACRLSKKRNRDYYVVLDPDPTCPEGEYFATDDFGLDTMFSGCHVLHTIENGKPVSY